MHLITGLCSRFPIPVNANKDANRDVSGKESQILEMIVLDILTKTIKLSNFYRCKKKKKNDKVIDN